MSRTIVPPTKAFRGIRGVDSWGSGTFGASRDGGVRQHQGLDFIAAVGDEIVAPITGTVVQIGRAYADAELQSIHIEGDGDFTGWRAKLLYAAADVGLHGRYVTAGDPIGHAQDVAGYWKAKQPTHSGEMKNHVHLEIVITEPRAVDPGRLLPPNLLIARDLAT